MKYIGVKIVDASPMDSRRARELKYKVGNVDLEDNVHGYEVTYPDGYKSWSPQRAFDEANRACDAMPFGHAIEALKSGEHRVAREGWNGKGMWVTFVKRAPYYSNQIHEDFECNPHLLLKGVDGKMNTWVPSISDLLADDWCIVD